MYFIFRQNYIFLLIGIFKFTLNLFGCPYKGFIPSYRGTEHLSFPDFDDTISRGRDYEALGGLESSDISDDVMMAHGEGFRATAGCVFGGSALLLTVNLLVRLWETEINNIPWMFQCEKEE